jgi:hypothetical protein
VKPPLQPLCYLIKTHLEGPRARLWAPPRNTAAELIHSSLRQTLRGNRNFFVREQKVPKFAPPSPRAVLRGISGLMPYFPQFPLVTTVICDATGHERGDLRDAKLGQLCETDSAQCAYSVWVLCMTLEDSRSTASSLAACLTDRINYSAVLQLNSQNYKNKSTLSLVSFALLVQSLGRPRTESHVVQLTKT